jgi:hypothetical protein
MRDLLGLAGLSAFPAQFAGITRRSISTMTTAVACQSAMESTQGQAPNTCLTSITGLNVRCLSRQTTNTCCRCYASIPTRRQGSFTGASRGGLPSILSPSLALR